jgi:hypothetical protein
MAKTLKALAVTRAQKVLAVTRKLRALAVINTQKVLAVKRKLKALMAMIKTRKASVAKVSVVQASSHA